jgi:2'-5' RNA ligase
VRFDRLGVFPPRGSVSVLWLGVGDGAREMIALQALVTQRLAALGFPPEDRPYTPHLTLARNRDPGAGRRVRAMLDDHPVVKIPEMRVRRVTFFRSNLQSPAARHEPMTEHVLMSECR